VLESPKIIAIIPKRAPVEINFLSFYRFVLSLQKYSLSHKAERILVDSLYLFYFVNERDEVSLAIYVENIFGIFA
jgi:hypothetical protein